MNLSHYTNAIERALFLIESSSDILTIEDVAAELEAADATFNISKVVVSSGVNIIVYAQPGQDRLKLLKDILPPYLKSRLPEYSVEYMPGKRPGVTSSIGAIIITPNSGKNTPAVLGNIIRVFVKTLGKQGARSPGVSNEHALAKIVNSAVKESPNQIIDITFLERTGSAKVKYTDIIGAERGGAITKGRRKADVVLITKNNKHIGISVKKDNAEMWESGTTYIASPENYALSSALYNVITDPSKTEIEPVLNTPWDNVVKINPPIALECSPEHAEAVVFGTDILADGLNSDGISGLVIIRSFKPGDAEIIHGTSNSNLIITGTKLIRSIADLDNKTYPWLIIWNDTTRNLRLLTPDNKRVVFRGLRPNFVTFSRAKSCKFVDW